MSEPIQPVPVPPTPPKKPWSSYWLRVPVALSIAAVAIYYLGDNLAAAGGKLQLPKCDSAKAEEMVKAAIKNGPMNKILNVEILALKDITTKTFTEEQVVCLTRAITNGGESKFAFSFEWFNKAEGQFVTQVAEVPAW